MTDNVGATQATVVVFWGNTFGALIWHELSAICESKTVLLLVSCGAFANEFLTRYRFKKSQIMFDEMLVRWVLRTWTCDRQT